MPSDTFVYARPAYPTYIHGHSDGITVGIGEEGKGRRARAKGEGRREKGTERERIRKDQGSRLTAESPKAKAQSPE